MRIDNKHLLEIRTAANKVITGKAGLIEGCRLVKAAFARANASIDIKQTAITALLAKVPSDTPTGDSLLYVNDTTYIAAIQELSKIEAEHRNEVLLECRAIYDHCRKALDEADSRKNLG